MVHHRHLLRRSLLRIRQCEKIGAEQSMGGIIQRDGAPIRHPNLFPTRLGGDTQKRRRGQEHDGRNGEGCESTPYHRGTFFENRIQGRVDPCRAERHFGQRTGLHAEKDLQQSLHHLPIYRGESYHGGTQPTSFRMGDRKPMQERDRRHGGRRKNPRGGEPYQREGHHRRDRHGQRHT